jgi:TonB family protein
MRTSTLAAFSVLLLGACAHSRVHSLSDVGSRPRAVPSAKPPTKVQGKGIVIADCVIQENGRVRVVKLARSDVDHAAALAAVRELRFSPAQKDGKPVAVRMLITLNFTGQ